MKKDAHEPPTAEDSDRLDLRRKESVLASGLDPDTPLRLRIIAAIAFPDGSMTASGLRREADRGRLIIERIAGKDYTTLANIQRMRQLCRVATEKGPVSGGALPDSKMVASSRTPSGSSATVAAITPQESLRARLTKSRRQKPNEP